MMSSVNNSSFKISVITELNSGWRRGSPFPERLMVKGEESSELSLEMVFLHPLKKQNFHRWLYQ